MWAKQRDAAAVEVQARKHALDHVSNGLETLLLRMRQTLLLRMRQVGFQSPPLHRSSRLHNLEDAAQRWHALLHTVEKGHIRNVHRIVKPLAQPSYRHLPFEGTRRRRLCELPGLALGTAAGKLI